MIRRGHGRSKIDVPKKAVVRAVVAFGVEGVDGIMLGGDENEIVRALARNRDSGNNKGLAIDLAVHWINEPQAEVGAVDVGKSEDGFVRVLASASEVVMVVEDVDLRERGNHLRDQAKCCEQGRGRFGLHSGSPGTRGQGFARAPENDSPMVASANRDLC